MLAEDIMGPYCEDLGGPQITERIELDRELERCGKLKALQRLLSLWLDNGNPEGNKVRPVCSLRLLQCHCQTGWPRSDQYSCCEMQQQMQGQ